jgi:hypothetical protein
MCPHFKKGLRTGDKGSFNVFARGLESLEAISSAQLAERYQLATSKEHTYAFLTNLLAFLNTNLDLL